ASGSRRPAVTCATAFRGPFRGEVFPGDAARAASRSVAGEGRGAVGSGGGQIPGTTARNCTTHRATTLLEGTVLLGRPAGGAAVGPPVGAGGTGSSRPVVRPLRELRVHGQRRDAGGGGERRAGPRTPGGRGGVHDHDRHPAGFQRQRLDREDHAALRTGAAV